MVYRFGMIIYRLSMRKDRMEFFILQEKINKFLSKNDNLTFLNDIIQDIYMLLSCSEGWIEGGKCLADSSTSTGITVAGA